MFSLDIFSILISIAFTGWNVWNAYRCYQAKRWGWFTISTVFALLCGWPLVRLAMILL